MTQSPQTSNPAPSSHSQAAKRRYRRFSDEFKRDAVGLIVHENYSFKAAAKAVDVSEKSLRDWHAKLAPQPAPCGQDATAQQLRDENKRLRNQLKQAEMEREILKKVAPGKAWERGKFHDAMN